MAKIENEQLDIKVDKGTERAREKVFTSKDLGCHIKFQVKNVVCTMVLALGFFLVVTQHLLPLSGFDTKKIWCTETAKLDCVQQADIQPKQYDLLSQELLHEKVNESLINLNNGVVQVFKPHGLATHLYIEMSAYRGGPRVFSIVGLTSKPTETYHKPPFACEWVSNSKVVKGLARKTLPDWNYGRLYTVVVITCFFAEDVGVRGEGGELILYASYGDQFRQPERIVALVESKGEYNASIFNPQAFPYDYVYCGSPVFGDISPQRIREWMAYHAKFFGEKSHFILYDAGGYHRDVRKVLEPWIKQGRASLHNVRQQEIYDGYYHNQFLVVNDCLFRSRFMANWTFFFDIDEYMYVDPSKTLSSVLNTKPAQGKQEVTQVIIDQVPVVNGMCVADNTTKAEHRRYGILPFLIFSKTGSLLIY